MSFSYGSFLGLYFKRNYGFYNTNTVQEVFPDIGNVFNAQVFSGKEEENYLDSSPNNEGLLFLGNLLENHFSDCENLVDNLSDERLTFPLFPDVLAQSFNDIINKYSCESLLPHFKKDPKNFLYRLENLSFQGIIQGYFSDKNKIQDDEEMGHVEKTFRYNILSLFPTATNLKKFVLNEIVDSLFHVRKTPEISCSETRWNNINPNFRELIEYIKIFIIANEIVAEYLETGKNIRIVDFTELSTTENRNFVYSTFYRYNTFTFREHEYTKDLAIIIIRDLSTRDYKDSHLSMTKLLAYENVGLGDALDFISMIKTDTQDKNNSGKILEKTSFYRQGKYLKELETIQDKIAQLIEEKFYPEEYKVYINNNILFLLRSFLLKHHQNSQYDSNRIMRIIEKNYNQLEEFTKNDNFKDFFYAIKIKEGNKTYHKLTSDDTTIFLLSLVFLFSTAQEKSYNKNKKKNEYIDNNEILVNTDNTENSDSIVFMNTVEELVNNYNFMGELFLLIANDYMENDDYSIIGTIKLGRMYIENNTYLPLSFLKNIVDTRYTSNETIIKILGEI